MIADKERHVLPIGLAPCSRVTRRGIVDNPLTHSGQINCLLLLSLAVLIYTLMISIIEYGVLRENQRMCFRPRILSARLR